MSDAEAVELPEERAAIERRRVTLTLEGDVHALAVNLCKQAMNAATERRRELQGQLKETDCKIAELETLLGVLRKGKA